MNTSDRIRPWWEPPREMIMKTEKEWLECEDPAKLVHAMLDRSSRVWWTPYSREPSDRQMALISCGIASVTSYAESGFRPLVLNWYRDIESGNYDPDSKSIGSNWTQSVQAKELGDAPGLVRCILGNPFRRVWRDRKVPLGTGTWMGMRTDVSIFGPNPPSWLTPRAKAMAQRIYDEFDFASLPVLADMLEDEGCDCEETLSHFRNGKPHFRGCWALDCILGLS